MKTVPLMTTDSEAFLAQFRPLTWETALKAKAAARGIPYQRLIRELLERGV